MVSGVGLECEVLDVYLGVLIVVKIDLRSPTGCDGWCGNQQHTWRGDWGKVGGWL